MGLLKNTEMENKRVKAVSNTSWLYADMSRIRTNDKDNKVISVQLYIEKKKIVRQENVRPEDRKIKRPQWRPQDCDHGLMPDQI